MASKFKWKAFAVVMESGGVGDIYFDCIPSGWIVPNGDEGDDEDNDKDDDKDDYEDTSCGRTVVYRFPSPEKLGKGILFRVNQLPNKNWPLFNGIAISTTDSRNEALENIKEYTAMQKSINKIFKKSIQKSIEKDLEDGSDGSDDSILSNTSGRNYYSDSKEEMPSGHSGTKRNETEQGDNHQNIQDISNKSPASFSGKIDNRELFMIYFFLSHCRNSFCEFRASYHKAMSILDDAADYLQQIISTHKGNLPSQWPKGYDSRWTLRYPEAGAGIQELMPNTGVYVSKEGLKKCKRSNFVKDVLEQVFTDEALRKCSFTGKPKRTKFGLVPAKPGLDVKARDTVVSYVQKHTFTPTKNICDEIKNIIREAHEKSKKTPKMTVKYWCTKLDRPIEKRNWKSSQNKRN